MNREVMRRRAGEGVPEFAAACGAWKERRGDTMLAGWARNISNYVQYAVVDAVPGVARHHQIAHGRGEEIMMRSGLGTG